MYCIGNIFLTKREVSTQEAIKKILPLPMRYSNVDVLYLPAYLEKNGTIMLKSLTALEKVHPDDTNVFASNIVILPAIVKFRILKSYKSFSIFRTSSGPP